MNFFPKLILFSAIAIAAVAAFFSVTGIGHLFAGAFISVIAMASALELGKLVSVSFLYRYWTGLGKALKSYMLVGTLVLTIITSAGIYGYLSSAYAKVAQGPLVIMNQIKLIDTQKLALEQERKRNEQRQNETNGRISQTQNRVDSLFNRRSSKIASVQDARSRQLERSLDTLVKRGSELQTKMDSLSTEQVKLQNSVATNRDIGTFIYVSNAIGVPLDTVVKWFILLIVAVFDPMSISLFLAYNIASSKKNRKSVENFLSTSIIEPKVLDTEIIDEPVPASPEADMVSEGAPLKTSAESVPEDVPEYKIVTNPDFTIPYYRKTGFNWGNEDLWKHDPEAVEHRRHNKP